MRGILLTAIPTALLFLAGLVVPQAFALDATTAQAITAVLVVLGLAWAIGVAIWSWRRKDAPRDPTPNSELSASQSIAGSATNGGVVTGGPQVVGGSGHTINYSASGSASAELPTHWFAVAGKPETFRLTADDLNAMYDAAVRRAPKVLAEDAQVEFRRMWLWGGYQMVVFWAWSHEAAQRLEIQVTDDGQLQVTNRSNGSLERPASPPPWRDDGGWAALVRQIADRAGMRQSVGTWDTCILRANAKPLGPGWSRWHVQLTDRFDPNEYCGLHDGRIERIMDDSYAEHPDFHSDPNWIG